MLHALANIEAWAIDVSWDIIARFAAKHPELPDAFFDDWVAVADDEARHHSQLVARLEELGSHFGALPVHEGLWETAETTADSLLARLAVMHMVHEAHGLDVTPKTIARFASQGDKTSAEMLQHIYEEEITHVAAGLRWFTWLCDRDGLDPLPLFYDLVRANFAGSLKPPFNTDGRAAAGMTEEWYLPLVEPKKPKKAAAATEAAA